MRVIGFVFLCLAAWAVPSAIRNVRSLQTEETGIGRVLLSVGFFGLMAYFGITSFLRARNASRVHEHETSRTAGPVSVHARHSSRHVSRPALDHAPVRRFRIGRGEQPALPLSSVARDHRTFRGLRSAHADGHGFGSSSGGGRSGPRGRRDLFAGRHGNALRGDPAGSGHHLDDHQLHRRDSALALRVSRAAPGSRSAESFPAPSRTTF